MPGPLVPKPRATTFSVLVLSKPLYATTALASTLHRACAVAPPEQLTDTTPSVKRAWPTDLRHRLMAVSRLLRKLEDRGDVEIRQPWADQPT